MAALQRTKVLDSGREPFFDSLALLAAQVCETPIAAVTLLGETHQIFKSVVGLSGLPLELSDSLCSHLLLEGRSLVVPDLTLDERFASNLLVTEDPRVRFYAGVPVTLADRWVIGSICVLDTVPRRMSSVELTSLEILARHAATELERRSFAT